MVNWTPFKTFQTKLEDSQFPGSPRTTETWNKRVSPFDVPAWIARHHAHPGRPPPGFNHFSMNPGFNAYEGVEYAWQLSETLGEFLTRLPPATTPQSPTLPWIYICNPFVPRLPKLQAQSQSMPLNEDEAPGEVSSKPMLVAHGGLERLRLMGEFADMLRARPGSSSSTIERGIMQERKEAVADILMLAHAARVCTGKWMLVCPQDEVNDIWSAIARATAFNQLGIAAKVAPRPEDGDTRKDRLICVYTRDFQDKEDLARVLQKLRELRLVEARGKPIYYKPGTSGPLLEGDQ